MPDSITAVTTECNPKNAQGELRARYLVPMGNETLWDRLQTVIRHKGWTDREWCTRAGLPANHLQVYRNRLNKKASATLDKETIISLAKAASIRVEWLMRNEGAMETAGPGTSPERELALEWLELWNTPEEIKLGVKRATDTDPPRTLDEWMDFARRLRTIADQHRGALRPTPTPPPDSEVEDHTKRQRVSNGPEPEPPPPPVPINRRRKR